MGKTIAAAKQVGQKNVVIAGGVGANSGLQRALGDACAREDIMLFHPNLALCTDNAAMIASAGYYYIRAGKGLADLDLTASPVVRL